MGQLLQCWHHHQSVSRARQLHCRAVTPVAPIQAQSQTTQGRELSTLAPVRALPARTADTAWTRPVVGEGVMSCPRAGCGKSACPVRRAGCGNGATVEPGRHRQTKGAATDMFGLQPLRHISTLPDPADPRRYRGRPAASQNGFVYSFGTGIGLVTLLQPLICSPCSLLFGFPETMASMSSGDGAEPRLSPATISQVRRQ